MILIEKKKKMSVIILLFFGFSLITGCIDTTKDDGGHDFEVTLLDGATIHLKDYRGEVVVVDLWAISCQPCAAQMVELETLYNTYTRNDLEIISINVNPSESSKDIQNYIDSAKEYDYDFQWIFGNDDGSIWENYKINDGIPTLYIFNKKGNIYYSAEGLHSSSDLAIKINELL